MFQRGLLRLGTIALLLGPTTVLAQTPAWDFSASAFGGGAFPFYTNFRVDDPLLANSGTIPDLTLKNSVSFGGKLTAWTTLLRSRTGLDLGAEVDVTQYYPNVHSATQDHYYTVNLPNVGPATFQSPSTIASAADIDATIVALNLLLRHPFGVTPDLPQGRWYPYLGIGGGAEIAQKKGTPVFSLTGMAFAPGPVSIRVGDSATDTAAVLQLLAGLKIFFTRHVALFGEYKFTHADHTFRYSYQVCNGCVGFGGTLYGGPPRTEKFSTDVNHVVGGLAVHF